MASWRRALAALRLVTCLSRARVRALTVVAGAGAGVALACASSCAADDVTVPVRPAPPSRHGALVAALADDAHGFGFAAGDWTEDQGDAPFFGLAWLSRRAAAGELDADGVARRDAAAVRAKTLLAANLDAPTAPDDAGAHLAGGDGALEDAVMAALGLVEYVGASGDRSAVPALDDFIDRLDAKARALGDYFDAVTDASRSLRIYGPTAVTALVALLDAQYALYVGGARAGERTARAVAIDDAIDARAFADLVAPTTGAAARAFAFAPGQPGLVDIPNALMLALEARLFRLTKKEDYRLEGRALYAALQALKLGTSPTRYASPYARALLGVDSRDLSTLAGQTTLAWADLLLFEITGDERFVDEADGLMDTVAAMRGPWCESQVPQACAVTSASCNPDHCTTGLLHHQIDGHLALPSDGVVFCSGCVFEALYVAGYRRQLANEVE